MSMFSSKGKLVFFSSARASEAHRQPSSIGKQREAVDSAAS